MRIAPTALSALLMLASAGPGWADGDPAAGQRKAAAACASCHGPDGNSASPEWPKLAGQHARYLEAQLYAFRSGERVNAVMNGLAAGLSDQDIADLAAFYAAQETQIGQTDPRLLPHGRRVYRGGVAEAEVPACMACHGPNGQGNPASLYPRLSGQHAQYTYTALQSYADGSMGGENSYIMTDIARRMTDRDMRAVATYIEGLR